MKDSRPRNIGIGALMRYRLPLTGIASILHRISGIILFLLIPFVLWVLHLSLSSSMNFLMVQAFLASSTVSFFSWLVLSALFYHTIAGIKHLIMDIGFFEGKCSGKIASLFVLLLGILGAIGIGVWIVC